MPKSKTLWGATEDQWNEHGMRLYSLAFRSLQDLYREYKDLGFNKKQIKEIIEAAAHNCGK